MVKGKKKPEEKRSFLESVNRTLGFSPDLLFGGITITLYGGKQCVVEGFKRILEYDESVLRVCNGKQEAGIFGSGLTLSCMTDESVVVEGNIQSAEYFKSARGDKL